MGCDPGPITRRGFLAATAAGAFAGSSRGQAPEEPALVAITLDLEMSRHYPTRDQMHWDYEKGNLDDATKTYAVEAAQRVKARGGIIHFFAVGRTMEQGDVDWLVEIARAGHPVGNHTYDHVNVRAQTLDDLQFRFRRAPWLVDGQTPAQAIRANIALAAAALKRRAGIEVAGFRTPGGFHDGLADRPDVQRLLLDAGYRWVSSKYPKHPMTAEGVAPTREVFEGIVAAQADAQPFAYPSGLVEVPMSPVSDVNAFRTGRWPLSAFLEAIEAAASWAIERRATFDFLAHPSCLVVEDPKFRAIDLLLDLVAKAGPRARIADLSAFAARATRSHGR